MIVVGDGVRLVAIVAIVAVAVVGRRVQLTVLVFFAALATDGVVAAHHVVDRRVFLMAGGFASTAPRGMVEVRRETVRPAVGVLVLVPGVMPESMVMGEKRWSGLPVRGVVAAKA